MVSMVAVPAWIVAIFGLLVRKYGEMDSPPALILLVLAFPVGLVAIAMSVYILAFTSSKFAWIFFVVSLCGCVFGIFYPDVSYQIEGFMGEMTALRIATRIVFFVGVPVLLVHSCFALLLAYALKNKNVNKREVANWGEGKESGV